MEITMNALIQEGQHLDLLIYSKTKTKEAGGCGFLLKEPVKYLHW